LQPRRDRSKKNRVRIAVVVPAYNEAWHIEAVLRSMPSFVDTIIVIDDASSDETVAQVRAMSLLDSRVVLLQHDTNRGVGAALSTGYREASRRAAQVVAVMAGDGQMDPRDLRDVLAPVLVGEADYVKGNRLARPSLSRSMPRVRRWGSRVLARITSWAAGVAIHDSQCGYTAIRVAALERVDIDTLWPRYGYPNDLIGRLALAGLRIAEVPVRAVYRGEKSGLRVWHVPRIVWLIGRVAWRRATLPAPVHGRLGTLRDEAPHPRLR
jgi:glycosyltransferase involved in cell wall biosynthesis